MVQLPSVVLLEWNLDVSAAPPPPPPPRSQMFSRAKRGLQAISAKSKDASDQERKVAKNVTTSLAFTLQELSVNFRKSQSGYLKSKSRLGLE